MAHLSLLMMPSWRDSPLKGRVILFGFTTEEDASNWFNDPEYQELSKFRKGTSTHSITFTKALDNSTNQFGKNFCPN